MRKKEVNPVAVVVLVLVGISSYLQYAGEKDV